MNFARVKTCSHCRRIVRDGLRIRGGRYYCHDRAECRRAYELARQAPTRPAQEAAR